MWWIWIYILKSYLQSSRNETIACSWWVACGLAGILLGSQHLSHSELRLCIYVFIYLILQILWKSSEGFMLMLRIVFLKCKAEICRSRKGTKYTGINLSKYLKLYVCCVICLLLFKCDLVAVLTHTVTSIPMNINIRCLYKYKNLKELRITPHYLKIIIFFIFWRLQNLVITVLRFCLFVCLQPCPPCIKLWEMLEFR